MAKDKEFEKKYKEEYLKRVNIRYQLRKSKIKDRLRYKKACSFWPDPNSPTGYSQWCEWPEGSTCEYPCNGDC